MSVEVCACEIPEELPVFEGVRFCAMALVESLEVFTGLDAFTEVSVAFVAVVLLAVVAGVEFTLELLFARVSSLWLLDSYFAATV